MTLIDEKTTTVPAEGDDLGGAAETEAGGGGGGGGGGGDHHRVVVVGSGFGGIGITARLLQAGITDVVVLERADSPGGTWRDNTYPGCQCDVPSNLYSLSFAPNPEWTTTFPLQAEIRRYLDRVAENHGVAPLVRYRSPMLSAAWQERERRWEVTTPNGIVTGDVLVTATGGLAEPAVPDLPGLDGFAGTVFHSACWDHDHDLAGERVAVIGTGASAIQVVPSIQPVVGHLDVYQRTPAWVLPHPNRRVTEREKRLFRRLPVVQRFRRALTYATFESRLVAFTKATKLMKAGEALGRLNLRRGVKDPALVAKLTPSYELGCKRVLISNRYYPALARPNVDVVTDGITRIEPAAIVTADGTVRPVDTIVLATGFHVLDNPTHQLIRGRNGVRLGDEFRRRGAYVGTTCHGFPNLFVLTGPNTGVGHTSLVYMLESQFNYVVDALRVMTARRLATVEVSAPVQDAFFADVQRRTEGTVWASGCRSWYLLADGRNGALWPTFTFDFRRRTRRFDVASYQTEASPALTRAGNQSC